jgi:hypothetical protein
MAATPRYLLHFWTAPFKGTALAQRGLSGPASQGCPFCRKQVWCSRRQYKASRGLKFRSLPLAEYPARTMRLACRRCAALVAGGFYPRSQGAVMPRGLTHHARPRRRPGLTRRVLWKWSILYRLRSVDRRTLAAIESPSQGDRAFPPTCIAEPIRVYAAFAPEAGRAKGSAMNAPLYDRRFSSIALDDCPVCWGKIALALVEPHPIHDPVVSGTKHW